MDTDLILHFLITRKEKVDAEKTEIGDIDNEGDSVPTPAPPDS